jgi:predicted lipoprotein with Yx(FWY)xxD motif
MNRARKSAVLIATTGALGMMVLSACGLTGGSSNQATKPSASASASGKNSVNVKTNSLSTTDAGDLGKIVTDQNGMTLYVFTKDGTAPPASSCSGACAAKWPPAVVDRDNIQVNGINTDLLGTFTRTDGTKQLVLNGSPLYRFAGDVQPGDTNGQGVNGTWFAATPSGGKAGQADNNGSNDSGSNDSNGNNGY